MTKSKQPIDNQAESAIPQESTQECDHDWEVIDDSFDHEYGTQTVIYERCKLCEKERDYEWPDIESYEGY